MNDVNQPLVSIITHVLNAEDTIEKTMLSIFSQTYKNIEYIIVDGDSTDNTVQIIKKYDKQISAWISEKDKSTADAFGKAYRMTTGDIIFSLSADDWIKNDAIQIIVDTFKKNKKSLFIYGDMVMVTNDKEKFIGYIDYKANFKLGNPTFNYPSVSYKREVYETYGVLSLDHNLHNDYDLLIKLYMDDAESSYTNKLKVYRLPGGIGESGGLKSLFEIMSINRKYKLPFITQFIKSSINLSIVYLLTSLKKIRGVFNG
tara:strand:+ start:221 stop:994 length:774 start_codon:yes stop_codon:yes gene_type:complete